MAGQIRAGVGGWTFEPWRGVFYPPGLPHRRELEFASRALTSIEINGTYYSTFKPASWRKWRDETPDGFIFAVKASRYCTNRKLLASAQPAIKRFLSQGLTDLGPKLGPINWQLMPTKRFDAEDLAAFLSLLPNEWDGVPLRHAIEVRHESFAVPSFYALARQHGIAIVYADGKGFPEIEQATADFTYVRSMSTREELEEGAPSAEIQRQVTRARSWARRGDVFVYFISGAKVRNPAAAQAFIKALAKARR
jgi:uncharacterized protein YecE (DUF72 family)